MLDAKGISTSYGGPGGRQLRHVTGTDHPRDRGASPASSLVHRTPAARVSSSRGEPYSHRERVKIEVVGVWGREVAPPPATQQAPLST